MGKARFGDRKVDAIIMNLYDKYYQYYTLNNILIKGRAFALCAYLNYKFAKYLAKFI